VSARSMTARIDVHQHFIPDFYKSALAKVGVNDAGGNPWPKWSLEKTVGLLDRHDMGAMLSISSPGTFFGDTGFAGHLCSKLNEHAAKLISDYPGRMGVMAVVPLPDVAGALKELEHALDVLKLDGVNLLTHVGNAYLGQPDFDELYAELDRRGAAVFVHPVRPPMKDHPEYGFPDGQVELTTETARAIANLFFNAIPERFPRIRWIMPHAGGTMAMNVYRLRNMLRLPKVAERMPKPLDHYLKSLWYDIAQAVMPATLGMIQGLAGSDRLLFGTDYPYSARGEAVITDAIEGVAEFKGFDGVRTKVERDNALALFPRFAAIASQRPAAS
jgi:predicted TIM-barrel fold metal-dependent hydrolase